MPKGSHIGGFDPLALLYMVIVFATALLVPALLDRFSSSHGHPDSDTDEDSGGGGPRRPSPAPFDNPPGGLLLDEARPARVRLRDGRRLSERLPRRERRPTREPARAPARRSSTPGPDQRRSHKMD